jgi:Uma2 family endonuclease
MEAIVSEAYELKEERKFTYADYKDWELKPGERYELIYGEPYAMSAPTSTHQEILVALSSQFYIYLRKKPCRVYPAPFDVRLFYEEDESDDTVVQPDITIICDEEKRGEEGCHGAPDLVVEILSPSNTAAEMQRKLKLYQTAGVREYWVVDPETKSLTVYLFQENAILTHTYGSAGTAPVSILPGFEITLDDVFA